VYSTLRRYLQAVHIVSPVMFALVSANVVNALFNWTFIYGHLGVRALGVPGSGWSTCVARVYMAGVLVFALFYYDRPRRLLLREHAWRVDFRRMPALLQLGARPLSKSCLRSAALPRRARWPEKSVPSRWPHTKSR
jgi:MATE family multidrug resistance protein